MCEQVEQVLTDALRCSDVGNMNLEQVVLRSGLSPLAPRGTTQRCAAERVFNRGTQHTPKSEGFIGRYGV